MVAVSPEHGYDVSIHGPTGLLEVCIQEGFLEGVTPEFGVKDEWEIGKGGQECPECAGTIGRMLL